MSQAGRDGSKSPRREPSTIESLGRGPAAVRLRRFRLKVTKGPDDGKEITIDESLPPDVLVGQSPSCDFRLTDREVSRRHAQLSLVRSRLRVVDQGSTNGTFVNGVLVNDALLVGGETLVIGATKIKVTADAKDTLVALPTESAFGRLIGVSPAMRGLFATLERIARSNVSVVIEGETGTGKEVCAEAIHARSARAAGPFVVFDCTTVAPSLIESALFGHERGAFTGAGEARRGVFEQADGGTLLIDEIGDLDRSLQAKLLRAIQQSQVQRLGGERWIKVDVRLLAATRRDLDAEVQAGRFRDDLFFRLMVSRVALPPLRERREDIGLLAGVIWKEAGGAGDIPRDLLDEWRAAPWPGNVRELHNAVTRLAALGDAHLGAHAPAPGASPPSAEDTVERVLAMGLALPVAREALLRDFERRYVARAIALCEGNVTKAAQKAGVAHRYFQLLRAKLEK